MTNRLAALHAWPAFSRRAATADSTTPSRSSVLSRMNGSEPPSSRTTFLRFRPATSATAAPARSEPVTDTPCTRGSAMSVRDLVVGGVDVRVRAGREARLVVDPLDRRRRLRALGRMLQQDRVADDEVRTGEPGHLVVRVVPRHDPEQDADGAPADECRSLAVRQRDRLVGEEARGLRRVVLVDRGAEVHLAERLLDGLAHLPHDDVRELLAALHMQLADTPNERRALLGRRRARPLAMGAVGRRDGVRECGVADRRVLLDPLARRRIGHCVLAHGHPPFDRRRPHASRPQSRAPRRVLTARSGRTRV